MTKDPRTQKPQAASHMLWFFIIPAIGFLGWASWKLIHELNTPKKAESALIEKVNKISTAKSAGGRWQAAYSFAQDLQQKMHTGELDALESSQKSELFSKIQELMNEFPEDTRLKKYLFLTLAQLKEPKGVDIFMEYINSPDEDISFYSAWGLIETLSAHPELQKESHFEKISGWLKHESPSFRKVASSFLVKNPAYHKQVAALLEDEKTEVQWNAAVALASVKNSLGKAKLMEMLSIHNIRVIGFRSKKDLIQFVATAIEAAEKLGDKEVLEKAKELKEFAKAKTPEGQAIAEAVKGFRFEAR